MCTSSTLMTSERIRRVSSRSGEPNVEVEGAPYHSPYDPRREAQKFYASHSIERADVIFHFGWGLGFSGEVLLARLKTTARVIVFEPDEELFRAARELRASDAAFKDKRFRFVVGAQVCQFFDHWRFEGCQETDQFLWLEWPAAIALDSAIASDLRKSFKVRLRDRAANLLTHFQNGGTYFENVLRNFQYQGDADVGNLFGQFPRIPLVIVSAGPSLDRNISDLRGAEDRCFILAVDTALRPLLAAGITPHAVIIADPSELNAKHVAGALPPSTYLIAEQAVHLSALRASSQRFLFSLGLFPDSLFLKFGFAKSHLASWGSVATVALDLACRLGADPIIFAGQDFAFSWGRDYASNTMYDGNPFDPSASGNIRVPDIWGRDVYTTENLIAYRDYFVSRIRQTTGIRFINATEGGILKEAVEICSLRDALSRYQGKVLNIPEMLRKSHKPSSASAAALEHLLDVLVSQRKECGCLDGFLELTAKEHLLKGDPEGIDRSILWGRRTCEEYYRTHTEGGVAPAHRGDTRAGVDV